VLPVLAQRGKPFTMVFWSRDPDGAQHNQGDSLLSLTPGINGPTSRAAVRNAASDLRQLQIALFQLGLDRTTDVILTTDHGFPTISKQSATSYAAQFRYTGVPAGLLPRGFVGIDLATRPDFRRGLINTAPASNADLGMTIASILRLDIPAKGKLVGRVLSEALKNGGPAPVSTPAGPQLGAGRPGQRHPAGLPASGHHLLLRRRQLFGRTVGLQ